jgi:hypothetical protein
MSGILHNRYLLYTVFIIALADFLYLGSIHDMTSVFVFVLVGLLVSFFNKNMIIVLSSGMIVANVLKYGGINQRLVIEGFEEGVDEEVEEPEEKVKVNDKVEVEIEDETPKKDKKTTKKTSETKEEFGQDKNVVYTSVDDMAISEQDKMMLANEKLLERMNKYKPLLDTLQGLTKNMAIMKGIATSASELKEDIAKDEKKEKKE